MIQNSLDLQSVPRAAATDKLVAPVFPSNIHICHFFSSKNDLLELLLPYFYEGLRLGEFCLWGVAAPLTVAEATAALDRFLGPGRLNACLESGQMEIFDVSGLYGTGVFDAMAVKDAFLKKVFSIRDQGWHGFRCDGMASALAPSNWRNYQTYEHEVTRSFEAHVTALCSYDLTKLTPEQVIEVVTTHQASVMKREGGWNLIVSSEHRSLEETRRKEGEFREVAEKLPQPACLMNALGDIYWCNQRWAAYTGLSISRLAKQGWTSVYDPKQSEEIARLWTEGIEGKKPFEMLIRLRAAAGEYQPFLVQAVPLFDNKGQAARWFATCTPLQDLSDPI